MGKKNEAAEKTPRKWNPQTRLCWFESPASVLSDKPDAEITGNVEAIKVALIESSITGYLQIRVGREKGETITL